MRITWQDAVAVQKKNAPLEIDVNTCEQSSLSRKNALMASRHFKDGTETDFESDKCETKEDEGGSETDSDASSYSYSDSDYS
ncbi:hypothetical protein M9458_016795, partial [Cirrhinus mrigala]